VRPPLDADAARRVERVLARRKTAAFVLEPVGIATGEGLPSPEFDERVRAACRRTGTVFVADEVATGFGRTGRRFASEHHDLRPDAMCLAKSLSGGHAGIGAVLVSARLAEAMPEGGFWSTYGWHPLSVTAALAWTDVWLRRERETLENVERASRWLVRRLEAMDFGRPHEVRAVGLAIAVEIDGGDAEAVADRAREEGVLVQGDEEGLLRILPALDLDPETAREGMDRLERALAR
jgi:acetylornithine/succinyldiaminopimelate/putrescine aminotransferase